MYYLFISLKFFMQDTWHLLETSDRLLKLFVWTIVVYSDKLCLYKTIFQKVVEILLLLSFYLYFLSRLDHILECMIMWKNVCNYSYLTSLFNFSNILFVKNWNVLLVISYKVWLSQTYRTKINLSFFFLYFFFLPLDMITHRLKVNPNSIRALLFATRCTGPLTNIAKRIILSVQQL